MGVQGSILDEYAYDYVGIDTDGSADDYSVCFCTRQINQGNDGGSGEGITRVTICDELSVSGNPGKMSGGPWE